MWVHLTIHQPNLVYMNLEAKKFAHTFLNEVTKIPYDEYLILDLLEKIRIAGEPRIITFILPLIWPIYSYSNKEGWIKSSLTPDSFSIKSAALKVISSLLSETSPEKLPSISECWSNSLFVDRLQTWISIAPPAINEIVDGEAALYLLGILSFSKDGYIREKAVAALEKFPGPGALSFILCRTVDWVPQVQNKALDILGAKLIPANASTFIKLLPLIDRLHLSSRAEKNLEAGVRNLYRSEDGIRILASALQTEKRSVRVQICRVLDKITDDIPEYVLDIIANDCDQSVRMWLTHWEKRMRVFKRAKALELRKLLINDASAKIRNTMILASLAAEDDHIYTSLHKCLFDRSSSIREMARYYIKRRGAFDFASLYRKRLTEKGENLVIAIAGLGETGIDSDYELILPLISGSSRQTREALKALAKLDSLRARKELLIALADHRSAVRHFALKELPKRLSAEHEETLLKVWQSAGSEKARRCVARSMLRLPPWIAAHALLLAVTITPSSQEAANALTLWYPSQRKCYLPYPPDEKEKTAIENALVDAAPFLDLLIVNRVIDFIT